jgi:hypothetical protein
MAKSKGRAAVPSMQPFFRTSEGDQPISEGIAVIGRPSREQRRLRARQVTRMSCSVFHKPCGPNSQAAKELNLHRHLTG